MSFGLPRQLANTYDSRRALKVLRRLGPLIVRKAPARRNVWFSKGILKREKEVGLTEFHCQPDLFECGRRSVRTDIDPDFLPGSSELSGRSSIRTDQLTDAGSQGAPLFQGCVANAPTAGAGMQARPSDVVVTS